MGYTQEAQERWMEGLGEQFATNKRAVDEMDERRRDFEMYKKEIMMMERKCRDDVHAATKQAEKSTKDKYMPYVEALVSLVEMLDNDMYVDIKGNRPKDTECYKKAYRMIRKGIK